MKLDEAISQTGILQIYGLVLSSGTLNKCMYCTVGGKLAVKLLQLQAQCSAVGARKVKEGIVSSERGCRVLTAFLACLLWVL